MAEGDKPRSNGVTAVGALMIAFGALGLTSAPVAFASKLLGTSYGSGRIQAALWDGASGQWMVASLAIGTLLALVLIASGIGVVRRRAWARRAALGYAVAALVHAVVGQLAIVLLTVPALLPFIRSGTMPERGGALGGIVGGVAGGLVGMVLPIGVLVAMTRASFKAELDG